MTSTDINRQINVLVVGETGTGKSSVINMVFDNEKLVITSERAIGCTSECIMVEGYPHDYPNLNLKIYDTVGVEESNNGTVPTKLALEKFDQLLKSINDGIHILLFCIRIGRLPLTTRTNYQLFFDTLCDRQVPCILVITHCDTENIIVTTIKETVRGASIINDYYNSRKQLINSIINNASLQPWNPNRNRKQFYLHLKKSFALRSNQDFLHTIQSFLEIPQQLTTLYSHPQTSIQLQQYISSQSSSCSHSAADHYHQQIQTSERNISTINIVILIDDYTCSPEIAKNSRFWYQKITNDLNNDFYGTNNNDYYDLYPQPGGAVTLIFIRHQKEIHTDYNHIKKEIKRIRYLINDLNDHYEKNKRFVITQNPYSSNYPRLKDYNDQLKSLNIEILELDFFSNDLIPLIIGPINQDKATIIYKVLQSGIIKLLNKYNSIKIDFK